MISDGAPTPMVFVVSGCPRLLASDLNLQGAQTGMDRGVNFRQLHHPVTALIDARKAAPMLTPRADATATATCRVQQGSGAKICGPILRSSSFFAATFLVVLICINALHGDARVKF